MSDRKEDDVTVPLSVLDLSPISEGGDARQSLRNTVDLARHAESWGYKRFWVAEHHNAGSLLSSATVVVMSRYAGARSRHIPLSTVEV